MAKKKLSKNILQTIKSKGLKPKPKWQFLMKNVLFWLIFALSALIGARALGVVFYTISGADLHLIAKAHGSMMKPIAHVFPLFWSTFFLLFLLFAVLGLHHTNKGYKMPISKLVALNLLISVVLGAIGAYTEDAYKFEQSIHKNTTFVRSFDERQDKIWSSPEEGRLSGVVVLIKDGEMILLDDFEAKRWTVNIQESTEWKPVTIHEQEKIRVIGVALNDSEFNAKFIAPWHPPCVKRCETIRERNDLRPAY